MALKDSLLPEFDQEMAATRKTLERVPESKFTWKPHAKSGSMGWLANHVATLPDWGTTTLTETSYDFSPDGKAFVPPPLPKSTKELLGSFDKAVKEARAALEKASDADLAVPWSLLQTGKVIFTMPRSVCWRSFVLNHIIHHRAQLGVYLRLNDIAVPATYGPSADESGM